MWSIHIGMQFGCSASEYIIQVSDQPVLPSSGSVDSTVAPVMLFTWYCQVVPTVTSPESNEAIWSAALPQYSGSFASRSSSSAIAASNCSWVKLIWILDPEVRLGAHQM